MATNLNPVKCKACARTLATVSDAGLIANPSASEEHGCDTCQRFRALFDAMQAADDAYGSLADRRDTYRPKQDALAQVNKTHIEFNNWLMDVEAVREGTKSTLVGIDSASEHEKTSLKDDQLGAKRSFPTSPTQSWNTDRQPARKRLKFSESVEFREDYRPSESYYRNGVDYVSGRYAAPQGTEHLDTSGNAKTFLKFTSMKKVGKVWVDIWKEESEAGYQDDPAPADDAVTEEVETDNVLPTIQGQATQTGIVPADARSQRLLRRNSNTEQATSGDKGTGAKKQATSKKRKSAVSNKAAASAPQPAENTNTLAAEAVEVDTRARVPNMDDEEADKISSSVLPEGASQEQHNESGRRTEHGEYNGEHLGELVILVQDLNATTGTNQSEGRERRHASHQRPGHNAATKITQGVEATTTETSRQPHSTTQTPTSSNGHVSPAVDGIAHVESLSNSTDNTSENNVGWEQRHQSLQSLQRGQGAQLGEFRSPDIEPQTDYGSAKRSANQLDLSGPQNQKTSSDARFSVRILEPPPCAIHEQKHTADPGANMQDAGTDTSGELLVMRSHGSKDQPS